MFTRNIISPTLCRSQESISNNWQVANKEKNKDISIKNNTTEHINHDRLQQLTSCCGECAQNDQKCCVAQQVPNNAQTSKDDISKNSQRHSMHENVMSCINGGKSADGETMDIGLLRTPSRQVGAPGCDKQSCANTHQVQYLGNLQ